jgi:phosphotransferase system enzyme I (PtsP)
VDRESVTIGELYSGFYPSVLKMLDHLCRAIQKTQKQVTVCGEMASDPSGALCLAALGYNNLSIYPAKAPVIHYLFSLLNKEILTTVKDNILTAGTKDAILTALKDTLIHLDPIFTEVL